MRKVGIGILVAFVSLFFVPPSQVNQVVLPEGESQLVCENEQFVTQVSPDRAICPPVATPTATPIPSFIETFDGTPNEPQAWESENWDVAVHSRDRDWWYSLEPMEAGHGSLCESPPLTHFHNTYELAAFICNNHLMTAIKASGYGLVTLTPSQLVDFSNGEAIVRFDVSTLRTSYRDWFDLYITPYDDNLMHPLEDWLPDLNGQPRNAIHIRMRFGSGANPSGSFEAFRISNFDVYPLSQNRTTGYEAYLVPSATIRKTFELRISDSHIRFGMPEYNLWWIDTQIEQLNWDQGIVQISQHSYNPGKSCPPCKPDTWHWDNVFIQPSIPFTILQADRRYVDIIESSPLTFSSPAPIDSYLRFSGIGNNIEVSVDGGTTWQAAQLQSQEEYHTDHFRTYWHPIPDGITSVMIRGANWYGGGAMARDISIWSRNQ